MRRLLTLAVALGFGTAVAHADLVASEPEAGAVLAAAPSEVVLHYSEPLEVPFSIFKVYRLDAEVDLSADNAQARLNGLAAELVNSVLELRDDADADDRVDTGLDTAGATVDEVTFELAEDLPEVLVVDDDRTISEAQGLSLCLLRVRDVQPNGRKLLRGDQVTHDRRTDVELFSVDPCER